MRPRRTRRARSKHAGPARWQGRSQPLPEVAGRPPTEESSKSPNVRHGTSAFVEPAHHAFDEHDERFFADSLAPSELDLPTEADGEQARTRRARIDSPRRRVFARYVAIVVTLAASMCLAAFTGREHRTLAAASAAKVNPAPVPPLATTPALAFNAEREPSAAPPATVEPPAADPVVAHEARERARQALEKGDVVRAESTGIESVELDPSDAEAWLILGAAEMAGGKSHEARATFVACTKLATRGPRNECAQMLQ